MNRRILIRFGESIGRIMLWFTATFAFTLAGIMAMDQYPSIHDAMMLTELGPTSLFEIMIGIAFVWAIVPFFDALRLFEREVRNRE